MIDEDDDDEMNLDEDNILEDLENALAEDEADADMDLLPEEEEVEEAPADVKAPVRGRGGRGRRGKR